VQGIARSRDAGNVIYLSPSLFRLLFIYSGNDRICCDPTNYFLLCGVAAMILTDEERSAPRQSPFLELLLVLRPSSSEIQRCQV
jgi:hypothetical protein